MTRLCQYRRLLASDQLLRLLSRRLFSNPPPQWGVASVQPLQPLLLLRVASEVL
jgi:hypothetical protein